MAQNLASETVSSTPPPSRQSIDRVASQNSPQPINYPRAVNAPRIDVSGSYLFLRDELVDQNMQGWLLSVSGIVSSSFAIVGEVGGSYKGLDVLGTNIANISMHSFLGGPRFMARGTPNMTPFGQVLAGVVRGSFSAFGEGDSGTRFALQPGGGVDLWFMKNIGVRIGGDYRHIFGVDQDDNQFRFHAGLVVGGGER